MSGVPLGVEPACSPEQVVTLMSFRAKLDGLEEGLMPFNPAVRAGDFRWSQARSRGPLMAPG